MAAGKEERFWNLCTEEKPKQFFNLLGEETMIQMIVNRLKPLIPMKRIFIVAAKQGKVNNGLLTSDQNMASNLQKSIAPIVN